MKPVFTMILMLTMVFAANANDLGPEADRGILDLSEYGDRFEQVKLKGHCI